MPKLIILSVILVNTIIPIALSHMSAPRKWLPRSQLITTLYICLWAYMCMTWYPQLVPLD